MFRFHILGQANIRLCISLQQRFLFKRNASFHIDHQRIKLFRVKRLRAVAQCGNRVVVHFDHQTVGPNGQMAFAQSAGQSGKAGFGKMLYHIIYNDKVIAGAVHFPEPQVNHLKAWYDIVL